MWPYRLADQAAPVTAELMTAPSKPQFAGGLHISTEHNAPGVNSTAGRHASVR